MRKLFWVGLLIGAPLCASGCIVDPTYDFCFNDLDCGAGDLCERVTTTRTDGRMCTSPCDSHAQCEPNFGFDGFCLDIIDLDPVNGTCFQGCRDDFDCFSSSLCVELIDDSGTAFDVCTPARL